MPFVQLHIIWRIVCKDIVITITNIVIIIAIIKRERNGGRK